MRNPSDHLSKCVTPARARIVAVAVAVAVAVVSTVAVAAPAIGAPPAFDVGSGLPVVGNFNPVTLNGTTQLTSATIAPFVIIDDSGALAGWHVTLLVPDFRNGSGPGCETGASASIGGANVSMSAPLVTAADAQTDMTGVTSAGFNDFTTARTVIAADAGDGAGVYDVAPAIIRLTVPANVLTGAYCTQATIAITSGP
jgi:hypothetical protein